jgi:outer membrane protein OmpA-like peptidoglycan-associated protein
LEIIRTVKSNKKDGRYSIIFNAGTNYKIEYKKQGYLSQYEEYDLYYLNNSMEEKKNIMLRSEADVGLMVFDKDLNKAIPANITVSTDGVVVNSFKIENYDEKSYTLELDINMNYTIVASAENYISDSIQINTSTTNTSKIKLMMEAEKVAYTFNVKDLKTKKKVRARLTFKNNDRDEIIEGFSDETHYLRLGDQYQVLASGDRGYLYASKTINATEEGAAESATEEMLVNPIAINASLIMNHITFETNSSDLSPGSLLELDQVVNFMNLNPNVSIEISAHSDDVGSDSYNLQLSSRRAASAKEFLVKSDVPENRMQSIGFGETQPLVPNDSGENRAKNRRVELKITAI